MAHGHLEYDLEPVDIANIDPGADADFNSAAFTAGWRDYARFADIVVDSDHTFTAAVAGLAGLAICQAAYSGAVFAIASGNWFGNIFAATGAAVDARAVAASFADRFITVSEFIVA
jgi:hypothetical protein